MAAVAAKWRSDSYFIFVDPVPTYKYGHIVNYLIVDGNTGELEVKTASFPPNVAGIDFWRKFEERVASDDRFLPKTEEEPLLPVIPIQRVSKVTSKVSERSVLAPESDAVDMLRSNQQEATGGGKLVGVSISGSDETYVDNDASQMADTMTALGFDDVQKFNSKDHKLSDVVSGIREATKNLGSNDKFLFYISTHSESGIKLDFGDKSWPTFGSRNPNSKPHPDVNLFDLLETITAGQINVIIDACHAGKFLDFLVSRNFTHATGGNITGFASAASDKESEGAGRAEALAGYFGVVTSTSTYTEDFIDNIGDKNEVDTDGDGKVSVSELEAAMKNAHDATSGLSQQPKRKTITGNAPAGNGTVPPKSVPGCTDPDANNYNPEATEEDDSCEFSNDGGDGGGVAPPQGCSGANPDPGMYVCDENSGQYVPK